MIEAYRDVCSSEGSQRNGHLRERSCLGGYLIATIRHFEQCPKATFCSEWTWMLWSALELGMPARSETDAVITTLIIMVVGILCTRLQMMIIPSVDNRTILRHPLMDVFQPKLLVIISTVLVVHSQLGSVSASVPRSSGCTCCDLR